MEKRIKIWLHSGSTSDIKEVTLDKTILGSAFLIIIFAVVGHPLLDMTTIVLKRSHLII